ncbi:MAG TPA: Gfo/Idh/MocA family oxidoreductase [Gemmatimonadaceae bacterium]|nr:Gfo/Idh/MocA family oxidoreductase [Gemmatimonadaceae bacterium]
MGARLRVAEVGLGWVGLHRHVPAMVAHGGFDIVGLIDRHPGTAQREAKARGLRRHHCGSDIAQVPWLDEVDAIVVATAPFAHYEIIRSALECGKHVLTEKPFTMTVDEGECLVRLARERQRVLGIVHNFQFAPSTRRLRRDIADGTLGSIRGVVARQYGNPGRRLPTWYENLPLGLFYDESPHLLYLLRRLSPGPLRMLACDVFPSTSGKVTPAIIQAQYESGSGADRIPVTLSLHFESPVSEWHVTVLGDKGLGDVDVFRDIYVRLPNDGVHDSMSVVRTSLAATWGHWSQHLTRGPLHLMGKLLYGNDEVFARFHTAATTGTPLTDISGDDALAVLRMQHEILERGRTL